MSLAPYIRLMHELDKLPWVYPLAMMSREEVEALYFAVNRVEAKNIIELGTGFGYGTRGLGFAALDVNAKVLTIDAHTGSADWQAVNDGLLALGLPVTFVVDDDLKAQIGSNFLPIDLLFIDTLHYYDQLKAELGKYAPLMAEHGEILIHGVLHKEVHTLEENRAVFEFLQANKSWDYQVHNTEFGLGRLFHRGR